MKRSDTAELFDGAPGLVYCLIGVSGRACIGVGDRDSAETFARNFAGALPGRPLGIEKIVVLVSVAVRPAIDSDGGDVARGVEAGLVKDACELVADIAFKGFKRSGEQIATSGFVLIAFGQAGQARSAFHADKDRLVRRFGRLVAGDI